LAGTTSQRRLGIGSGIVGEIIAPTAIDVAVTLDEYVVSKIFANVFETVQSTPPSKEDLKKGSREVAMEGRRVLGVACDKICAATS
jgi:hypothetical protein